MVSNHKRDERVARVSRRSRFGCRNCKLRKLKCDEDKPHCQRCVSFGITCNFMSNVSDLQPVAADTGRPLSTRRKPEPQKSLTSAVWTSDTSSYYLLNAKCQDFITRHLGRSLSTCTSDDPKIMQVNRRLLSLAFAYPCLMHASLAVAFAYDRYLGASSHCRRTSEECYHWSQGTILLNKRLKEPIQANDKDPIWGTAAALAILSFASPDAVTPEEAWPLRSSDAFDLDWLRMIRGKMSLWHTVNPLRSDSIYHVMAATFAHMNSPLPERGTDGIPAALAAICDLKDSSTAESNPYYHASHAVSQMLNIPDRDMATGQTLMFTQTIRGPFEEILRKKDPAALLLLYLWYCKASRSIWWIKLRARVECPSICLFLRLYHEGNDEVHAFLPGGALADKWK